MELSLKPRGKATCSQTRASLPQTREETFISATLTAPLSLHIWSGPISDTPVTGGEMELRCTTLGMHVGDLDLYNYVSTHSEKVSRSFLTQQALCNLPSTRRKHESTAAQHVPAGLVSEHMLFSTLSFRTQETLCLCSTSRAQRKTHSPSGTMLC